MEFDSKKTGQSVNEYVSGCQGWLPHSPPPTPLLLQSLISILIILVPCDYLKLIWCFLHLDKNKIKYRKSRIHAQTIFLLFDLFCALNKNYAVLILNQLCICIFYLARSKSANLILKMYLNCRLTLHICN